MPKYLLISLFSIFVQVRGNSSKLQNCLSSQYQQRNCQVLVHYQDYQQVTCLTKDEIKELSKGMYICESTHCWYADCQLRATNLGFQAIQPQCKCEEQSRDFCKNSIDNNKRRCVKLQQYSSEQWVTCRRSQDLVLGHSSGCPFPQTHCWHSCQSEKFDEQSGEVSDECKCSAASLIYIPMSVTYLVMSLLALIITRFF
jgi:hypothetical protein